MILETAELVLEFKEPGRDEVVEFALNNPTVASELFSARFVVGANKKVVTGKYWQPFIGAVEHHGLHEEYRDFICALVDQDDKVLRTKVRGAIRDSLEKAAGQVIKKHFGPGRVSMAVLMDQNSYPSQPLDVRPVTKADVFDFLSLVVTGETWRLWRDGDVFVLEGTDDSAGDYCVKCAALTTWKNYLKLNGCKGSSLTGLNVDPCEVNYAEVKMTEIDHTRIVGTVFDRLVESGFEGLAEQYDERMSAGDRRLNTLNLIQTTSEFVTFDERISDEAI